MRRLSDRFPLSPETAFQLAALLPLVLCALGLYLAAEMTPRWSLGMLTYGAVALSYIAGTLGLGGRFRLLPVMAPLACWLAQLLDMEWGLGTLAIVALGFAAVPLYGNRYRLFGIGAALALALGAVKIHSYGFY